jgi:eukaryotic-like serine/threonine-protein kinase
MVPAVIGEKVAAAESALEHRDLHPIVDYTDAAGRQAGTVVGETPPPGKSLERGGTVTLEAATGQVNITAISYSGRPYPQVDAQLTALGLHPTSSLIATDTTAAGEVLSLTPTGQIPIGTTITVTVATAVPTTTVAAPTPPTKPAPGPGPRPAHKPGRGPAPNPGPTKHPGP